MPSGGSSRGQHRASRLAALVVAAFALFAGTGGANALTPIPVQADQDRVEITTLGDAYEGRGDSLQVETAVGGEGVSGRMTVRASVPGTSPNWMVFALTNKSDKSLVCLPSAPSTSNTRAAPPTFEILATLLSAMEKSF